MTEEEEPPKEEPTKPEEESSDSTSKYKEPEKPETSTLVNRALEAADNLNKASERMEKATKAAQEVQAVNIISGRADAGTEIKPKTDDEKAQEEADQIVGMFSPKPKPKE